MPPEGFTTVTISEELTAKLDRLRDLNDCSSQAEAIGYAVNIALAHEDEMTLHELIQLLDSRLSEIDELEIK